MGGVDKGFVLWAGEPLVVHALRLLAPLPQVLISANRSLTRYQALGYEVITDDQTGFAGPLAGLHAAWGRASQPWLLSVPVDSPCLPSDLVRRLWEARVPDGIVVARSPQGVEPLVFLAAACAFTSLEMYWGQGGRRAQEWFVGLPHNWLDLSAEQVINCNTPQDIG